MMKKGPRKEANKALAKKPAGKPYARPEPINIGEVLTDFAGKQWKMGKSIGVGGFGEIYLATDDISRPVNDKANFVIKIEPHTNGPLFVEINFYLRVAKTEMIEEWKRNKKIDLLGMPAFVASGSHMYKGQQYRFMVIPRFGKDLYKIIQEKPGNRCSLRTVQALALQIIDIFEYIHEKNFIHGDLKASNLLLGHIGGGVGTKKQASNQQVYLLDYGLAAKYVNNDGSHLPYSPDARKAHNGTLEYTSRDAHIGAFSRRGDLEILGYNLLEWLCGKLPWSPNETPEQVHKQKNAFMQNASLKKVYPTGVEGLSLIEKFLKYVAALGFDEKPNYAFCKELFKKGLPPNHKINNLYLDDTVSSPAGPSTSGKGGKAKANKRLPHPVESSADVEEKEPILTKKIKLPEENKKQKRVTRTTRKVKDFNWTKVLSSDPEKIVRAASLFSNTDRDSSTSPEKVSPSISNPTPAMIQIMSKKKENLGGVRIPYTPKPIDPIFQEEANSTLTPAMREILMLKKLKRSIKLRKSISTRKSLSENPRVKIATKITKLAKTKTAFAPALASTPLALRRRK